MEQNSPVDAMGQFYQDLAARQMGALWQRQQTDPSVATVRAPYAPCLWRWPDVQEMMDRAAALVRPGPQAERRVIQMINPGVAPSRSATHTLAATVQLVLPGEVAPSHRHTLTAIRFILRGSGASTLVSGEHCTMNPGDLILTPAWSWHGHVNETDGPMLWMDGLDGPIVRALRAGLFEDYGATLQEPTKPDDSSLSRYGMGHLRPAWERSSDPVSPLLSYPWAQSEQALWRLAQVDASPFDDVALEYTNPSTGGHVLPTIACWIQMLRPGTHTLAHRHSTSAVYHVFRGSGATIVDGVRYEWQQGDFLALPPWGWHEHLNYSSTEEAILFSITDVPVFESLNLYREDAYAEHGGRQVNTSRYTGQPQPALA